MWPLVVNLRTQPRPLIYCIISKGLAILPFGPYGRARGFFAPRFPDPFPPVPSDPEPPSSAARLPFFVLIEPMQPTLWSFLPTAPRN